MPLMDGHKEDGELTECGDAKAIADLDKSSLGRRWDQKPGWNQFMREEEEKK